MSGFRHCCWNPDTAYNNIIVSFCVIYNTSGHYSGIIKLLCLVFHAELIRQNPLCPRHLLSSLYNIIYYREHNIFFNSLKLGYSLAPLIYYEKCIIVIVCHSI